MKNNPIAIFDSGIGGSTILKEIIKVLPNEEYIYYADTSNNPYGNKSKDELYKIVDNIIIKILKFNPKIIVCACNTATAMVLDDIRKKYTTITFIGTEPAVKVAHDQYSNKNTIVLTTKGTGESEKFRKLFTNYKTINCTLVEAPKLANLIETNKDTYPYLKELLEKYSNVEIVVLGCTHFPLAKNEIKKVLGDVNFIDGSKGIANRVVELLTNQNLLSTRNTYSLKVISSNPDIEKRIHNIINS